MAFRVCGMSFRLHSVLFHHNNYLIPINVIVFFPIIKVTVDDSRFYTKTSIGPRNSLPALALLQS